MYVATNEASSRHPVVFATCYETLSWFHGTMEKSEGYVCKENDVSVTRALQYALFSSEEQNCFVQLIL